MTMSAESRSKVLLMQANKQQSVMDKARKDKKFT